MTYAAQMFQPLAAEEGAAAAEVGAGADKVKQRPIVPVPEDAPDMNYWHRKHGKPSASWPYHDGQGQIVGYVCRWDFTDGEGRRQKEIRPVCYCDIGNSRRAWRSVGMPAPRPLYRLPDVLARSSSRVLVLEGEKAADAAAKLFEGPFQTTTNTTYNTTNTTVTDTADTSVMVSGGRIEPRNGRVQGRRPRWGRQSASTVLSSA